MAPHSALRAHGTMKRVVCGTRPDDSAQARGFVLAVTACGKRLADKGVLISALATPDFSSRPLVESHETCQVQRSSAQSR